MLAQNQLQTGYTKDSRREENAISLRSLFTETILPQRKVLALGCSNSIASHPPQKGERTVLAKIGQHLNFALNLEKLEKKCADLLTKDNLKFSLQLSPSSWESRNFNALWKLECQNSSSHNVQAWATCILHSPDWLGITSPSAVFHSLPRTRAFSISSQHCATHLGRQVMLSQIYPVGVAAFTLTASSVHSGTDALQPWSICFHSMSIFNPRLTAGSAVCFTPQGRQ